MKLATGAMSAILMAGSALFAAHGGEGNGETPAKAGTRSDKAPLGSLDFYPSPEHPTGWRGDGTGRYPGANPPLVWDRHASSPLGDCWDRAKKPKEGEGADGAMLSFHNGRFAPAEWLVLGPFNTERDEDKHITETTELIPNEAQTAPDEGEVIGDKKWTKIKDQASLDKPFGQREGLICYLCTYLYSPEDRTAGIATVGSNNARGWLNGERFNSGDKRTIKKGWNRLLIRSRYNQGWWCSCNLYEKGEQKYEQRNICWQTPMPGTSNATPVLIGNNIVVTSEPNDLVCVDKNTGKIRWVRSNPVWYGAMDKEGDAAKPEYVKMKPLVEKLEAMNLEYVKDPLKVNNSERTKLAWKLTDDVRKVDASYRISLGWGGGNTGPTPCSDGKFVYAWFGETGILACYDLDGNRQWIHFTHSGSGGEHGINGSPMIAGDKIVVFAGKCILGFDKNTGKNLWNVKSNIPCYATLMPVKIGVTDAGIAPDGKLIRLENGSILSPTLGNGWDGECASPIVDKDAFFLICRKGYCAVQLPSDLAVGTKTKVLAMIPADKMDPEEELYMVGSPVYYDGVFYTARGGWGRGDRAVFVYAIEARTGALIYREKVDLKPTLFYGPTGPGVAASMVLAANKYLYVFDTRGNTLIFSPGRTFQSVGKNSLMNTRDGEQETTQATPIFEGQRLYIRGYWNLYCVGAAETRDTDANEHK